MSHYFCIEEIKIKLVTITALALSGEEFCQRYKMGSEEHHHIYNLADYTKQTKLIVSSILIEVAVKVRSLVDALKGQGIPLSLDKDIITYGAGNCADSKSDKKDFRFICNKIIHAEGFNLNFIGKNSLHKDMVWWSSEITVSGLYQNKKWEFFFSVLDWADQIISFLKETEAYIETSQKDSRDLQLHS